MGKKGQDDLFVSSMQYPQTERSWILVILNPGGWGTWQIKRTGSYPETVTNAQNLDAKELIVNQGDLMEHLRIAS